jgi:ribonucleoside-diphosphate reductase beta chain
MSLLEARKTYKPFEYPWAFDMWKRQQQVHWLPEEVPLGEDCRDWAQKISEHERNLLTQIFRFLRRPMWKCRTAITRSMPASSSPPR